MKELSDKTSETFPPISEQDVEYDDLCFLTETYSIMSYLSPEQLVDGIRHWNEELKLENREDYNLRLCIALLDFVDEIMS